METGSGFFLNMPLFQQKVDTTTELYKRRRKMVDFYEGKQIAEDDYLLNMLSQVAERQKGVRDLLFYVNITRKIVNALSMCYKEAPEITVMKGDEEDEQSTDTYREYLEGCNKDVIFKDMERYTNLMGRTAIGTFYDPNTPSKLRLELIPQFVPVWNKNSYNIFTPDGIAYELPKEHYVFDTSIYRAFVVWDSETVNYQDLDGKGMKLIVNGNEVNGKVDHGYGSLPFIFPYSTYPTNDFFTADMRDLIRQNQEVNFQRSLINFNIKYNSFKALALEGVSKADMPTLIVQSDQAIALGEGGKATVLNLALENIADMKDLFEYTLMSIYDSHNLKSWVSDKSQVSGVSAKLQNVGLMEMRQQGIDMYKQSAEIPLYNKIQSITEAYSLFPKKLPKLGGEYKLKVEFGDYEIPVDPKDEMELWGWKFEKGLATPQEYIMQDRGITEEEAEAKFEEIKKQMMEMARSNQGLGGIFNMKDLQDGKDQSGNGQNGTTKSPNGSEDNMGS